MVTQEIEGGRPRLTREVVVYFVLAYAISWLFWGVIIALHLSVAPGRSKLARTLYFAGIQGPWLAGLLLSLRSGGWKQVRRYYATIVRPGVNPWWFVVAALAYPAIAMGTVVLAWRIDRVAFPWPLVVRPQMGWAMLLFGQMLIMHGEEYGWRGYCLPRMEKLLGTLGASIVLGVLWSFWHSPLFWTSGSWQSGSMTVYTLATVASCVVQAAIFFRARCSTLAGMLSHGALNATQFVLDQPDRAPHYLPWMWGAAVIVAVLLMPRPWFGGESRGGDNRGGLRGQVSS